MKNRQVIKSKELEMCTINKKYPSQINMYTDEVKNLVAKRLEYLNKLNINKKSITNLKSYLNKLSHTWSDIVNTISTGGKNKIISDNLMNLMEEELNMLHEELNPDEEEILEKLWKECKINYQTETKSDQMEKDKMTLRSSNNNKLLINNQGSSSKKLEKNSYSNKKKKENLLPKIFATNVNLNTNNNLGFNSNKYIKLPDHFTDSKKYQTSHSSQSPRKEYKGIFTKYEYLNTKNSSKNFNRKANTKENINNIQSPEHYDNSNNSIEEKHNENSVEKENSDIFTTDYENTHNNEFTRLIKKRSQLEKINKKLEKNLKEVEKLNEKKFKDLNILTENNQKKLHLMHKVNNYN